MRFAIAGLAFTAAALGSAASASAAIKCRDGFQLVQGNYISTPYCRDNYVGAVARRYGIKASDANIRNNPNFKRHVCRLIGSDIRIRDACLDSNPNGRGDRF